MALSRTQLIRILRLSGIALAGALIAIYAIYRSLAYARGPAIEIQEPINGSAVSSSTVVIQGRVDRVSSLDVNGTPISFDAQGDFSDEIIVFPGVNIITLSASDQFMRTTHDELEIYGGTSLPTASQLPATTSTTSPLAPDTLPSPY